MRPLLIGAGISAATVIVLLLVLEFTFRLFFPQPLYATALAPWGFWHQPSVSFLHASDPRTEGKLLRGTEYLTRISYNSLGIRGPEYQIPKPIGVKRVVIVGDSFGDAMEVEFPETMGQILERTLDAQRTLIAPSRLVRPPLITTSPDLATLLWSRLRAEAADSGAPLLAASLRVTRDEITPRALFFDSLAIEWVSLDLPAADRFPRDGHWNAQGNASAAQRIFDKVRTSGLLRVDPSDRVEVINLSSAAYVTCHYLHILRSLGKLFDPDLVIAIDSGTDYGPSTTDLCSVGPDGSLLLKARTYSSWEQLIRNARSLARANSHFLTWVFGLIERLPAAAGPGRVPVPTP